MDYEIESFKISFNKLGLKKGDSIFLSTSLGMLGKAKNTKRFSTIADGLLDSLIDIIGPNGNIFVPTYSYSFGSKRKIFSVKNTKSKTKIFAEFGVCDGLTIFYAISAAKNLDEPLKSIFMMHGKK